MSRRVLAVAVALTSALALAGCETLTVENPFKPAPLAVRLDGASPAAVTVDRGQTIVVTLEANVTTGYRWEAVAGFAPTLNQLGTADYVALPTESGRVGAPGEMTFRFRAAAPGTTPLELVYRRPFETGVAPAKTVRYEVSVR